MSILELALSRARIMHTVVWPCTTASRCRSSSVLSQEEVLTCQNSRMWKWGKSVWNWSVLTGNQHSISLLFKGTRSATAGHTCPSTSNSTRETESCKICHQKAKHKRQLYTIGSCLYPHEQELVCGISHSDQSVSILQEKTETLSETKGKHETHSVVKQSKSLSQQGHHGRWWS